MQQLTCVLALTIFTGFIACDNDVTSASQLRRVRLLAVQAEPLVNARLLIVKADSALD